MRLRAPPLNFSPPDCARVLLSRWEVQASGIGHFTKKRGAENSQVLLPARAKPGSANRCTGFSCRGSLSRLCADSRTPKELHILFPPIRPQRHHRMQRRVFSAAAFACAGEPAEPKQNLLAALEAVSADGGGWVDCCCSLKEAFKVITSLNTAAAVVAAKRMHGSVPTNQHSTPEPDDCLQPPSVLEDIVAASWGLPRPPVPFMVLERSQRRSPAAQFQQQDACGVSPLLFPLVVTQEEAEENFLFNVEVPAVDTAERFALFVLHPQEAAGEGQAIRLRLLKARPQQLFFSLTQALQRRRERNEPFRTREALALLHAAAAADIVAAATGAADINPQDGGWARAATAATSLAAPKTDSLQLREFLLAVLQHAVDCLAAAAASLPPSPLLQTLGLLVHLGSPRPLGFLSPRQVEQLLLHALSPAKALLLDHQRRLDLLFFNTNENASSSSNTTPDAGCMQSEAAKGGEETQGEASKEQRPHRELPLRDAVFVLALLGWMQRHGLNSAKPCGQEILASLADCVGERIEELDAIGASNLLFAVSWPRVSLAAWQEYLLFMAARRLLKVSMEPLLAARVVCALADIGLEDHMFYASILRHLEPEVPSLTTDVIGGLLRACAKVRVRELSFLLPVFARLEASAAELHPARAAQALEAAGDLDIKTRAFDGLWHRVCEALKGRQLLHASLLTTALLLLEKPQLLQELLDAWTIACVSGSQKISKHTTWNIIKKHRFIAAASAAGILGSARLPEQLWQVMNEIETKEGSKVRGCGPESSSFHLEVAASLGKTVFEQEARAGPFLVDLLIHGKRVQQEELRSAENLAQNGHGFLIKTDAPTAEQSSLKQREKAKQDCSYRDARRVPRLHVEMPVHRYPWESRQKAAREIPFSVL